MEAADAYRRALELRPNSPEAHNNLAVALTGLGQMDEGISLYFQALELKPDYPEAHNNLGAALAVKGRFDEAITAHHRALQLKPDFPEAHNNLGNALRSRGRLDDAIASYHHALQVKPEYPEAHNNLGSALKDRGDLDDAISAYRRALEIKPDYPEAHSNLIFTLQFIPSHGGTALSEEHRRWNVRFNEPLKQFVPQHGNDRHPERRLRVGYVSPDFRNHAVARYVLPLFERHDRERVEILCYSGVAQPDSTTERFHALAAQWRSTVGISDAQMAEIIRHDGVDVLVDLTMHTAGNRLPAFARKPAPVQASWLAYPGTTGLRCIDYRLSDAQMEPAEEPAWYSEETVRLPDCWCCYQPAPESPEINTLPALSAGRVTFGSLNTFAKVNESVLALWARLLQALKGSRLLMLCPEGTARQRVRAHLSARGITPDRVEFVGVLPHGDYLGVYQRIDICLDPFPFNGMTTTCDALWMGTPVLTLPGELPATRAGLSLLSSIGLGEFVASSEEDYVRLAVELAADLQRLASLRSTLRLRMKASPLMDAPRFARNIEAAYRSMWRRWIATGG